MTQAEARALVVSLAGDRADLDRLLELSAGKTDDGATVFRAYWVAALLETSKRQIIKAEGVEWDSVRDKLRGWLFLQSLEDKSLTVPEGYEANVCSLIPCDDPQGTITAQPWSGAVETVRTL